MSLFENYTSKSFFDEAHDNNEFKDHWKEILENLNNFDLQKLQEFQDEIDWHIEDNGVTYNIYETNESNSNKSWQLDPIPFVITAQEWEYISKGVEQRAKLLNLVFRDLYSQQKLIKDNIIPAELVFGHKGYVAEAYNFGYKENFQLYFYATDMSRGPDGKMWIISDRTQAPSGLGYAIENRLTMNSISKELYPKIINKKLYPFVEEFKSILQSLTNNNLKNAAFLTPGPYNETYFEHAYLSSFLGIDIVQGNDLLSKNGSLWLKTLGGLQQINTLVKRVDDLYCDPLELNNDSQLGVAGLLNSVRQNNLNVLNPIGSAILENVGLNPFMERICEYFLQEKLLLPQIATWWCGQKQELQYVLENIHKLIIKKIDRSDKTQVYFGRQLTNHAKETLKQKLLENPSQYVAQEEIAFSTVPYFTGNAIEPRNAVVRAFCLKNNDKFSVMDGGLVRVSTSKTSLLVSSQKGASSKDLWILGTEFDDVNISQYLDLESYVETSIENITTLKAENLFWLGRYLARSIDTTRLITYLIKKITNFYRYEIQTSLESQQLLQKALTHMTMTYPGFLNLDKDENLKRFPMTEIKSIIKDVSKLGSLAFTFSMLASTHRNLKDLLTFESSKLFEKIYKDWLSFAKKENDTTLNISTELNQFLIYLMAYKELVKESIFKEQGLILYDIGYKIESAILLISKARSLLCFELEKNITHDLLDAILNSLESFNAYRAHYKSSLSLENVTDFLLFNEQFPKSLYFITRQLLQEFKELPKSQDFITSYEAPILEALELLEASNTESLFSNEKAEGIYLQLDKLLEQLSQFFVDSSNEFSNTYFSHYDE